MSVAFILNPGYNTINNVHHTFWDQGADCVANESLNQALEVSTSVKAPIHVVGTTHTISSTAGGIITDAPQFEIPIVISSQVNTDTFLPNVSTTGISVQADLVLDSTNISGVNELTCGTLHYTTLDPAIPSAGNWSTFDATSDVDLHGYSLTDSTRAAVFIPQSILSLSTTDSGSSVFGNSLDSSGTQATLQIKTNNGKTGNRTGALSATPSNKTGATAYWNNPGSVSASCDGGDMQLYTYGTGKIRLVYDNFAKAITVNQSGAMSFNSTFAAGAPVDGSFGTSGQILQSNGSAAPPSWVAVPAPDTPAAWSEYPATQNVDMAAHELNNCAYLEVKPVGNSLGMIIQNTLLDTNSSAAFVLQTDGDGSTIPSALAQFALLPSNALNNSWEQPPSSLTVTTTEKAVFSCTDLVKVSKVNNAKAFVMNDAGAMSFDTDFNSGTPSYSFGTTGQLLSSNGVDAPSWVNAPAPGDPSTWALYPAIANIDVGGYIITNSNRLNCENTDTSVPIINLGTRFGNDGEYNKINFEDGGSVSIGTIGSTTPAPSATTWDAAGSSIISKASRIVNSSDTFCLTSPGSASALVRNTSGAVSFSSTFDATTPTYNFGTSGQIVQSNGSAAAPSWVSPAISGQYVLYVAKNGLDTNAGDITHPKLTIQSAINAATALYPQQVVILVQPGVYSGALSITRPNITLLGLSPSSQQNLLTQIAGNISIACTASQDLYYSQVCIANLLVSGSIIDTSTVVHTLNIEACRIAANGQVFAQTSSADNRTRLVKCTLLQASTTADVNPMMLFSSGSILLNQLDVTAKNNCNLVKFNGTAILPTCALCTFTSDTASTVAEPIILLAPTNGTNYPFSFGYNAFIYSSYAPKITHPESAGICVSAAAGRPYITVVYNTFALAGTNGSNYAIYDTGYNTATAGYYFYFSNSGGVNPAGIHAIIPSLQDFGAQASVIYGFSGGGSQNKYTLSAVA